MTGSASAAFTLGAQAFLVGLSGAMSPGSYLTVTIARTMRTGPFSASLMLVGHAVLEGLLLVGFAFGLQGFLKAPTVVTALGLVGGLVLLWMGLGLVRGAVGGSIAADLEVVEDAAMASGHFAAITQGALVSISNPWWTLWWATIGVKLAMDGLTIGPLGVAAFFLGHQLADVSWYLFVIAVVHRGRGMLSPRPYRFIMGVLGGFLLYMGARFLGQAFGVDLPWLPF